MSDTITPVAAVASLLRGSAGICRFHHYPVVDSTNIRLKEMAENGAPEGTVILADSQSQGKGCEGRPFFSPPGTGVYMSVLLRSIHPLPQASLVTVAAAVAVSQAIEDVCALETRIKWVNDIFLGSKKVVGILTESSLYHESEQSDYAVLGIGINIFRPPAGFPDDLRGVAGCLYEREQDWDVRSALVAEVLNKFFVYFEDLSDKSFISEYRRRSNILGRSIICREGEKSYAAQALDIDQDGGLVVRLEDGSVRTLSSGEVRIRPQNGYV
ncbi:MAG: biotin--[acetyl-CoA-carboxylase] ligase [Gracilibacteraceae bacterium]|nr:biotin--[acetyl-CoA-carboxylase] ligase [Gracilibacteraceae bacterium]